MGFWSLGFHGKSDITRAVRVMKSGKSPGVRMSSGCPVTQEKPTKTGAEKRQVDTISYIYIYILYAEKVCNGRLCTQMIKDWIAYPKHGCCLWRWFVYPSIYGHANDEPRNVPGVAYFQRWCCGTIPKRKVSLVRVGCFCTIFLRATMNKSRCRRISSRARRACSFPHDQCFVEFQVYECWNM